MAIALWQFILACVLVLFVYLLKTNHAFKYHTKLIYYYGVYLFTGVVVFPLALLRPKNIDNIRPIQIWWNFTFSLLGIKVETRNFDRLGSTSQPGVIVVNHQSSVDMICIMQVAPRRSTYLAKKEILYLFPFGQSCWLCGLIFVDRLNPDKAKNTMRRTAETLVEQKSKLWVFPEGTRNFNGTFLPFKKGAFHLAVQAQIPIYPVVHSSFENFYNPKKRIFNSGRVISSALPPVETKGLTSEDVNDLIEKIRSQMLEEYHKISKEVLSESPMQNGKSS